MTDNEINVAITETLGQTYHRPTEEEKRTGSYYQYEPDYCHDLNAMHAAEENGGIAPFEMHAYVLRLHQVLKRDWDNAGKDTGDFDRQSWDYAYCHATARQRAEAFLKCIGKWVD